MSKNVTKRDIVLKIHEQVDKSHKLSQKAIQDVFQLMLDNISDSLRGGQNVELRNFGVFKVKERKSRIGRNPNKPEQEVVIPNRNVVKFEAGKELKEGMKSLKVASS